MLQNPEKRELIDANGINAIKEVIVKQCSPRPTYNLCPY